MDEIEIRSHGFANAKRFLRTAILVDDEAYMYGNGSDAPKGEVVTPGRQLRAPRAEEHSKLSDTETHSLNARSIMDAFSAKGVVCGVVGPTHSELEAMKRADIVVLDWFMQDGTPDYTLKLLKKLLTEEQDRNALRLIAIYTGEADLEGIGRSILHELQTDQLNLKQSEEKTTITFDHGRIALYAKPAVNLPERLNNRRVAENELPGRLVADFASMTEGLLPGIALTALTAAREDEHKILARFSAELDPAFVSHAICLPHAENAEWHFVTHVAEELRGLVDEAVAAESPAGNTAIKHWIRRKAGKNQSFKFGNRVLQPQDTVDLVTKSLKEVEGISEKDFKYLSSLFAGSDATHLDQELAWLMSFRTIYNAPAPRLWLGSVVAMIKNDAEEKPLLCIMPRCDSVRLESKTTFPFLSLIEPEKKFPNQIVAQINREFVRYSIGVRPSDWVLADFEPEAGIGAVPAKRAEQNNQFEFTDTCGVHYVWRGELKAEYAQRVAQSFASTLSRVAVDESEWLRRIARSG